MINAVGHLLWEIISYNTASNRDHHILLVTGAVKGFTPAIHWKHWGKIVRSHFEGRTSPQKSVNIEVKFCIHVHFMHVNVNYAFTLGLCSYKKNYIVITALLFTLLDICTAQTY